jgi:hypothetical protein
MHLAVKSYTLVCALVLVWAVLVPVINNAASAQESTPEATPITYDAPFDPIPLYEALLYAEFPTEYFPTDATAAATSPWLDGEDPTLDGSVAAVQIIFENAANIGLAYVIYPTVEAAQEAFERAVAGSDGMATPVAEGAVDGEPAIVLDYGDYQVNLIRVNNVLVDGASSDPIWAETIAAYGVGHLRRVLANLPSAAATPAASSSGVGSAVPADLYQQLLAAKFDGSGVPANLLNPQVTAWIDDSDTDLVGTVGAATVAFTGGDNMIAYIFFPTTDHAKRRMVDTVGLERSRGVEVIERDDLSYPAVITVNGEEALCVLRVDYVLVASNAVVKDGDVEAATQEAIALALAGAEHVVKLAEGA